MRRDQTFNFSLKPRNIEEHCVPFCPGFITEKKMKERVEKLKRERT